VNKRADATEPKIFTPARQMNLCAGLSKGIAGSKLALKAGWEEEMLANELGVVIELGLGHGAAGRPMDAR
jgi:hypothetical protein